MPSFELSKLPGVTPPRALSESDLTQLASARASRGVNSSETAEQPGVALEISAPTNALEVPFDNDRVSQIREALRDGSYPLVPTEIADAIIAARVGFGLDT